MLLNTLVGPETPAETWGDGREGLRTGGSAAICIVRRDATDSAGMSLSKLWEIVKDREARRTAAPGVSEWDMT